jgi:multiple sugar transport system ATP-binding protein
MADKMAVMSGGVLQQYDRPEIVFEHPANTFVAGFVGSPAMNLIPAEVEGSTLRGADGWRYDLTGASLAKAGTAPSPKVILGARHSTIRLSKDPGAGIPGHVYTVEPTGDITFVHVRLGQNTIVVSVPPEVKLSADEAVSVAFDQDRLHLFDAVSGRALGSP